MLPLLRAASLLALMAVGTVSILPRFDLPDTAFDEADTPTIQTVTKAAPFRQCIPVRAVSTNFAQMPKPQMCSLSPRTPLSGASRVRSGPSVLSAVNTNLTTTSHLIPIISTRWFVTVGSAM